MPRLRPVVISQPVKIGGLTYSLDDLAHHMRDDIREDLAGDGLSPVAFWRAYAKRDKDAAGVVALCRGYSAVEMADGVATRSGPNIPEAQRRTERIVVRLPPHAAARLRAVADAAGETLGQTVTRLVGT